MPGSDQQFQQLIHSVEGPELFRTYCAPCHGLDAKGHGPAAAALKTKPADLTVLSKTNGGQFPEERVRRFILGYDVRTGLPRLSGDADLGAHLSPN